MSAIVGIYHKDNKPVDYVEGKSLLNEYLKYPANDIQLWRKDHLFLGCHSQWITPESMNEQNPFYDDHRQKAIVADAIIDNRKELFAKLQIKSSALKTITDCELILLAYEKWGESAPKHLIGDFAFMIWDEKKQTLFGARDFSGARTLYYFCDDAHFVFSTLIEPLFKLPYVKKSLNEEWIAEFIAIPTMVDAVDIHSTVYKKIAQIPPSHTITVVNGKVTLKRYSTLPEKDRSLRLSSSQEYVEAFREVFNEAIHARLRTFKQIGTHLSGGLDSSSVAGFASKLLIKENKPLHSFSYVPVASFEDWTSKSRLADERPYIQETVKFLGNVQENYVSMDNRNPYTDINDWLNIMEMPYKFYANSYWIKGIFEEAQKQGIGVMLNGQRGNTTISWGNAIEYQLLLLKKLKWFQFYRELSMYSQNRGVGKTRILKAIRHKISPLKESPNSGDWQLINSSFAQNTNVFEKLKPYAFDHQGLISWQEFRNKHFEQLFNWNINGTYTTKLSVRHMLWDRDPTNDLRVIRFCLSIPENQFVQNGFDRALIRRASEGFLPESVRLNQKVRGIQGADGVYRMKHLWETFISELKQMTLDSTMHDFFNIPYLKQAIASIESEAKPEVIYTYEFNALMRSLIVYRFLNKFN